MVGSRAADRKHTALYFYQDLMLPVLLLRYAWRLATNELAPEVKLKAMDSSLLRRTLTAWFRHNVQPLATSKALFIHRNAGISAKSYFRNADRAGFAGKF